MIYFAFTDDGDPGGAAMSLLDATGAEAALDEARDVLRAHPRSSSAHVFDGDRFVGSVEAPPFGYVGANGTSGFEAPVLSGEAVAEGPASAAARASPVDP